MDIESLALAQQKTEDRSVRNEGRIKKLETEHETLHTLATSVAVMAEQMKSMNSKVGVLTDKVDEIESRPAKLWQSVIAAVISAVVGGIIGFALSRIGVG